MNFVLFVRYLPELPLQLQRPRSWLPELFTPGKDGRKVRLSKREREEAHPAMDAARDGNLEKLRHELPEVRVCTRTHAHNAREPSRGVHAEPFLCECTHALERMMHAGKLACAHK